eukprot:Skav226926  [mRNA]  locus=scaffold3728:154664:160270:- [translate_table: standard]
MFSEGRWCPTCHVDLANFNRGMTQWIEARFDTDIGWRHVKAHSDHPWNDAADSTAWSILSGWVTVPNWDDLWPQLMAEDVHTCDISWLWMLEHSQRGHPSYPRLLDSQLIVDLDSPFSQPPRDLHVHALPQRLSRHDSVQPLVEPDWVNFCVATCNVLSLYNDEDRQGGFVGARMELLCLQFQAAGVDMVGIQESRSRLHGHCMCGDFHVISSSADASGHDGVQLWIAKVVGSAPHAVHVAHEHLRIVHSCHRILILDVATYAWVARFLDQGPSEDALSISETWISSLDSVPADTMAVSWAFVHWGNTRLNSWLMDQTDVDVIDLIEAEYWQFVQDLPVWRLLSSWERLQASSEPHLNLRLDADALLPSTRQHKLREPFPRLFRDQTLFLHRLTARGLIAGTGRVRVPVLRLADGTKCLCVIHLYSGRRREHDCHYWLHMIGQEMFPGFRIRILSLDTAIHATLCDLLGSVYAYLQDLMACGVFCLVLCGPPCETWSSARHLRLEDDRRAPRPLRSEQRPWGIDRLTGRELAQLGVGSALLFRAAEAMLHVCLRGGAGLTEHPAPSPDSTHASIWRTQLYMAFLRCLDCARLHTFEQYKYGAETVKPTSFLVAGADDFSRRLAGLANHAAPRPEARLGGRDPTTATFRTARAKEYPGPLCEAMCRALLGSLRHRIVEAGEQVVEVTKLPDHALTWFEQVEAVSATTFTEHFCPDYQPRDR